MRLVACFLSGFLFAGELPCEVTLSSGYRYDEFFRNNTFNTQTDTIRVSNVHLWQGGVEGRLAHATRPIFLSGFAYWSLGGGSGQLRERISSNFVQLGRAHLKNYAAWDYQGALGIFLRRISLALSGGYAFDRQRMKLQRGKIAFPASAPFEKAPIYSCGYETTATWKGPFIGVELFRVCFPYRVSVGYEGHFAQFQLNHSIPLNPTAQLQGFANRLNSDDAFGNVAFLRGSYCFCKRWKLGLLFKYQNWRADSSPLRSGYFSSNGIPPGTKACGNGRWISYLLSVDAGCVF